MGVEFFGSQDNPNAIVIRSNARALNIEFFSPEHFPQQIGLMSRPSGYIVPSHVHNEIHREISLTQEVLMIRKGSCEVTLYADRLVQSRIKLSVGDVILLASGGHSIQMLEDCEILEVKQGPYLGPDDKTFI